ncbi:MAG: hypothetical protein KGZ61_05385 [Sandarakinorhabdus sp.]|nr:hypothetical protein [Sandarakinorhabdus sp.]
MTSSVPPVRGPVPVPALLMPELLLLNPAGPGFMASGQARPRRVSA